MIGALWNGISGLDTFQKAINVESNNISNVNTVGYKEDVISFQDMVYANQYGRGTSVDNVSKDMAQQGGIQLTNNGYDVAIEGKGFFMVGSPNNKGEMQTHYTRAGNFTRAESGLLETQNGMKVLGLTPQSTNVISSDTTKTKFDSTYTKNIASQAISNTSLVQTVNSKSTDYTATAVNKGVSGSGYKSRASQINDIEALINDYKTNLDVYSKNSTAASSSSVSQITTADLSASMNNLTKENDKIKINIGGKEITQLFDTNKETTMKKFSDQISAIAGLTSTIDTTTGKLTINSMIPGKEFLINSVSINDNSISVYNTQNAKQGTGIGLVDSSRTALKAALEYSGAKLIDITTNMSLVGQESLNVGEIQVKLSNLNLSDSSIGTVEIDNGNIFVNDNGSKYLVGKIQTATFTNEQGLKSEGNNIYAKTLDSGDAVYAGNLNKIVGSSLESSTANLGTSLTGLMIYQKAFEANSKSITTSDEMLKTAIELKR